tara:strand:+ start:924 stop:1769 length:846 start_codon:yes stop_codon:yes gene_type:complete
MEEATRLGALIAQEACDQAIQNIQKASEGPLEPSCTADCTIEEIHAPATDEPASHQIPSLHMEEAFPCPMPPTSSMEFHVHLERTSASPSDSEEDLEDVYDLSSEEMQETALHPSSDLLPAMVYEVPYPEVDMAPEDAASAYWIQELSLSDPTWEVLQLRPCYTPPLAQRGDEPPLVEECVEDSEDDEEAPACEPPGEPRARCPILRLTYQSPETPPCAPEDISETNAVRHAALPGPLLGPLLGADAWEGRCLSPRPRRRGVPDARGGPRRRGGGIPEFAF